MKRLAWLVVGVVVFAVSARLAAQEDITLTTYYPSPRGMYDELRTAGDVHIGDLGVPSARLHVVQPEPAAPAAFRVDDEAGDTTPFIIDENGNVGIGTTPPGTRLDLNGALSVRGMSAPAASPTGQGRIYFDSTSNAFQVSENGGAYGPLGGASASDFTRDTAGCGGPCTATITCPAGEFIWALVSLEQPALDVATVAMKASCIGNTTCNQTIGSGMQVQIMGLCL